MNKLILNMPFTTLNEYINAERSSRHKAAEIKKQQTNAACYLAKEQRFKLEPVKHDVIFTWCKPNNKKDHDNIAFCKKFILDGLVKAKILQSDGSKFVNNFHDVFVLDTSKNYTHCIVEFNPVEKDLITNYFLMQMHPEVSMGEAVNLKAFAKKHTIEYKECYGDGSIIYPMWLESLK